MLVPTVTAPVPVVVAWMPASLVPVMVSPPVVSRTETAPAPVVLAWMPIAPVPLARVVTVTAPPFDVARMASPVWPRIESAEVTLTVLLLLAVAEIPPAVPLIVPPEAFTVTAPAPLAAVLVAEMPRPPEPVTLEPV